MEKKRIATSIELRVFSYSAHLATRTKMWTAFEGVAIACNMASHALTLRHLVRTPRALFPRLVLACQCLASAGWCCHAVAVGDPYMAATHGTNLVMQALSGYALRVASSNSSPRGGVRASTSETSLPCLPPPPTDCTKHHHHRLSLVDAPPP